MGARSKRVQSPCCFPNTITRLPLWGRDQNRASVHLRRLRHYQTTPVGARSKLQLSYRVVRLYITRLPLWGRDQNSYNLSNEIHATLPDYPCGGEIKTQSLRNGASGMHYQTTPVGARSKLLACVAFTAKHITRLPLWGRDQNGSAVTTAVPCTLPDYPCGGEIKTDCLRLTIPNCHQSIFETYRNYHSAPPSLRYTSGKILGWFRKSLSRENLR